MQIVSQVYGGGDDGEIEGGIAHRPKAMTRRLARLTYRRLVALTAQA